MKNYKYNCFLALKMFYADAIFTLGLCYHVFFDFNIVSTFLKF